MNLEVCVFRVYIEEDLVVRFMHFADEGKWKWRRVLKGSCMGKMMTWLQNKIEKRKIFYRCFVLPTKLSYKICVPNVTIKKNHKKQKLVV